MVIVCLITFRSWSLNKRADRGEIELEYNDVSIACSPSFPRKTLTSRQDGDQKGFRYTY
jgi:hypothetical protein